VRRTIETGRRRGDPEMPGSAHGAALRSAGAGILASEWISDNVSGFWSREHPAQQLAGLGDELADTSHGRLRDRGGFMDLGHHLLGVDHGVERGVKPRERHHVVAARWASLHAQLNSKPRATIPGLRATCS
jgi:hypothetical protein